MARVKGSRLKVQGSRLKAKGSGIILSAP